jgi:hypothetical protein
VTALALVGEQAKRRAELVAERTAAAKTLAALEVQIGARFGKP